ncbi:hypothetical protein Phum_PHUM088440 [Pediculus humanus corporis]|uniref:HTH psq-type domain-containing protein n=1 Tax=Pediculus humanus subsp. corporis TaxID=121224 RepID=E0VCK6_PEDHC|nr:uncharacterized protein Phum_PHUM088440 [Pediculus humanus corporis]EEB11112.1 hypothetical protein Phum_PHUM088440 [Pediculus humanus corporis]
MTWKKKRRRGRNSWFAKKRSRRICRSINVKVEPSEDAPSPYTDISMIDDETSPNDKVSAFPSDMRNVSSGIATYVPQQKPEWKRYKQYTRNDILSAIEAVRTGMSALQAARKYGVPSRTLYDKVKKLGITTSRPFKRGTNGGNSNSFPYNMSSGLGHVFGGVSESEEPMPPHPGGTLLEPMFLQHALERSKGEFTEREALMALASAHAQASAGSGSGSRHSGSNNNSSPENNGRSPSPNMLSMKYMRHGSMTPSPNNDDRMDDEDQVEDLSITRKEIHPPPPTGSVIVPPMRKYLNNSIAISRSFVT